MTIEGRIADIVDDYTVVVNLGSTDGVKRTHRYGIFSESDPIEDPETGEKLGRIEYKKAEVKPVKIHDEYSVMETDETVGGFSFTLPGRTRRKKLTADSEFKHGDDDVEHNDKVKFLREIKEEDDG